MTARSTSARVRWLAGAAGLALIAWLALRQPPQQAPTAPASAAREPRSYTASPALTSGDDEPAAPQDDADPALVAASTAAQNLVDPVAFRQRMEQTLALYRTEALYPAWSRPVDGSQPHLLDWRREISIGQPYAADRERREIEAHVTLDYSFAGPGEPLVARVEVFRTEGHVAVNPDKLTARVEQYSGDGVGWNVAAELPISQVGNQWQVRFVPSAIAALATPSEARLVVRLESGEFAKELPLPFRYAASAPLVVHRQLDDRVTDGSLAVRFAVDVKYAAPTLVQAVLFDASGTLPIATYSDWFRPTGTGATEIDLRFFGKAIRAKGRGGPYRIKQLHGLVRVPGAEPHEVWWGYPDDATELTARYALSAFSDAAYGGPETAQTIARYEELIRNGPEALR